MPDNLCFLEPCRRRKKHSARQSRRSRRPFCSEALRNGAHCAVLVRQEVKRLQPKRDLTGARASGGQRGESSGLVVWDPAELVVGRSHPGRCHDRNAQIMQFFTVVVYGETCVPAPTGTNHHAELFPGRINSDRAYLSEIAR